MQYVFKSVHELKPEEVRRYLELYRTAPLIVTFHTRNFITSSPGRWDPIRISYSWSTIRLVSSGSLGAIEVGYNFGGEQLKFGLTVDAMIEPEYR